MGISHACSTTLRHEVSEACSLLLSPTAAPDLLASSLVFATPQDQASVHEDV